MKMFVEYRFSDATPEAWLKNAIAIATQVAFL